METETSPPEGHPAAQPAAVGLVVAQRHAVDLAAIERDRAELATLVDATFSGNSDAVRGILLAHNKQVIFSFLEAYGVSEVIVSYSGGGDSGQTDDIDVVSLVEPPAAAMLALAVTQGRWNQQSRVMEFVLACMEFTLEDAVELLLDEALSLAGHSSYENGDGGEGKLTIRLSDRSVTLEHSDFYTASTDSVHQL